MKFLDWINDNLWLVVVALVLVFAFKCSTPQTTISLENKAEKTEKAIEAGTNGCQSLQCQDAMRQAKDYIKDSLDTVKSKDNQIQDLNNTIKENNKTYQKEYANFKNTITEKDELISDLLKELVPWRTIKRWFYYCLGACVIFFLIYIFRGIIWTALKTALKLS